MHTIVIAALVGALVATPCTAQTADPARPGDRDCAPCPEMVRIPPGAFMMGAPPGEHARENVHAGWAGTELPQHKVTIDYAFSLGKYEVTRAEFAAFAQATGHRVAGDWCNPGFQQTDRDPAVNVSWNDAKAYVAWLSQTTGKKYRLPTEAEWEYAARAGTSTARYWGERHQDACRYANVNDLSHGCRDGHVYTAPVGRFQPNVFGLFDMLGNVYEWTEDCWNASYAGAPVDGSFWQRGDCSRRVLRGGSWGKAPWLVRTAFREGYTAGDRDNGIGFRVARTD